MTKKPRGPYKLDQRAVLDASAPFTPEELGMLIAEAAGPPWRAPHPDDLTRLCGIFAIWRGYFLRAQHERERDRAKAETAEALGKLQDAFPCFKTAVETLAGPAPDVFQRRELKHLERAERALAALVATDVAASRLGGLANVTSFESLGPHIYDDVNAAMLRANPGWKGGVSAGGGPLARIVTAIVPRITGEIFEQRASAQASGRRPGSAAGTRLGAMRKARGRQDDAEAKILDR